MQRTIGNQIHSHDHSDIIIATTPYREAHQNLDTSILKRKKVQRDFTLLSFSSTPSNKFTDPNGMPET